MDIFASLHKMENSEMMRLAGTWILERRVQLYERERFRIGVSARAKFKSIVAWKYCRTDVEINRPLPDFPPHTADLTAAKEGNHYFFDGWAFCVHWWLCQNYSSTFNVDTTFFYWDMEHEYLSLNRPVLTHPVMVKIGSVYGVFLPPEWNDADDQWINCTWCGDSMMDCLVEFMRVINSAEGKKEWRVKSRETGNIWNLKGTKLRTLLGPDPFKGLA